MRRLSGLLAAFLLLGALFPPSPARAQQDFGDLSDLGNALRTISKGYADNYVQPVTNTFGAGVNSALFRGADVGNSLIPGFPLNVYVGVSIPGTFTSSMEKSFRPFGDGQETFMSNGRTLTVEYTGDGEVPTVIGSTTSPGGNLVVRDEQTGAVVADNPAPQGLVNTPIAPLVIPQLAVGSIAGTDAQLRYFPKSRLSVLGSSYGTISVLGLAVRHDLDQWVPVPVPFNVAVQGSWNRFSLENDFGGETQEVLDASGWAVNLQASKGLPLLPITFYGGLQYETFSVDYSYTFPLNTPGPPPEVSLSQSAANNFRGLVGVTFTAAVIRINVDYAAGNAHNVLTAGFGVRL
ncbi:MAG: DUF6588 family protein [Salinibacter sp.]